MNSRLALVLATALACPVASQAADPVKIEIFLGGQLKQSVTLLGPNASARFNPHEMPDTTLELRLIAPEPVILEMKETAGQGSDNEAVGRVKLVSAGSSVAVADIKGNRFHNPSVLVRKD